MSTLRSVAERAGVSVATVSHVINRTRHVAPETSKRVNDALAALNYQPNSVAKSLRMNKTHTIGVHIKFATQYVVDAYAVQVAYGIQKSLDAHGYDTLFTSSELFVKDELRQIKSLIAHRVDGLIIMPVTSDEDYLGPVRKSQIPMIFVDRQVKGDYGDCVLCDNFQGTYDAVAALLRQGHRKIGIIIGRSMATTLSNRYDAYIKALTDAGINPDERRILPITERSFASGAQLMAEMIEHRDVTAVFVADNLIAQGGLSYINDKGLVLPRDLSLVVFDDFEWQLAMKPTISAVRQAPYELGLKAAQLLLERIDNPQKPFETCLLSTRFIQRASVSAPPKT